MRNRHCPMGQPSYDVRVSKRRITLNLDEDVVEALKIAGGESMSAVANEALRSALERRAHQAALLQWLDELDAEHGTATPAERAEVDDFLGAAGLGGGDARSGAA